MEENNIQLQPNKKVRICNFCLMFILFVTILFVSGLILKQIVIKYASAPNTGVGSLRTLFTAQNQFKNIALKDRDSDGKGEFGYFVELSGFVEVPQGKKTVEVRPPFITSIFGATSSANSGIANKSGYNFILYLPSSGKKTLRETGKKVPSLTIFPPLAKEQEEIDRQEEYFAAFAWPVNAGSSGQSTFFINQLGELYITNNQIGKWSEEKKFFYSGDSRIPEPEDIFDESGNFVLDGHLILNKPHPKTGLIWRKLKEDVSLKYGE